MAHGMMLGKKMPMADKSAKSGKSPKAGPDDNTKMKFGGQTIAPNLPDRDGPAKQAVNGKDAGKPKTSAKAPKSTIPSKTLKSMKSSIAKMM